ncbi:MAG: Gfo/Idh/MocA family oxidoreductase [Gemmataceae bacterium]|nr:Gfo/Idh/MocA family oxidoreductase [Gemmataceae bacterium]
MSGKKTSSHRRDFLRASTAVAAGGILLNATLPAGAYAQGSDEVRVGVIGCGGRGSGAAHNVLHSARNVTISALADAFEGNAKGLQDRLKKIASSDEKVKELGNKVEVPNDRVYSGLDAFQKIVDDPKINYVILATPPGFRSIHIAAAVKAKKNIFTEKPVCIDGPGARTCLAAFDEANTKGLAIAAGTQRRHQATYIETIKQLHEGAIGEITAARCYWNQGILWAREPKPEMTPVQAQVHNWYNNTWLCGDHIVEQHVHNLDVINWIMRAHPAKAVGMGHRTRTDPRYGHIFDFFAIDYEYPNGVHMLSMSRQISNCANSVSEAVVGTKGNCQVNQFMINGKSAVNRNLRNVDPYVQEHTDLIESIRAAKPINELKNVMESSLTAVMGRMSAYTGKEVSWNQALNSKLQLMPDNLTWETKLPDWTVAVPGKTPLI